jgi:hypothetical protein
MRLTDEDRAAIRFMADLWFEDEGPTGEGWRSDKAVAAQETLKALADADRSCATCRWAEAIVGDARLDCRRELEDGSLMGVGIISLDRIAMENGAASLLVAPAFGCVQWEAK